MKIQIFVCTLLIPMFAMATPPTISCSVEHDNVSMTGDIAPGTYKAGILSEESVTTLAHEDDMNGLSWVMGKAETQSEDGRFYIIEQHITPNDSLTLAVGDIKNGTLQNVEVQTWYSNLKPEVMALGEVECKRL